HLAVEGDAGLLEAVHEAAVRQAVRADRGVQADLPEAAEAALLVAAVAVGVLAGLEARDDRELDLGLAAPHHPLGLREDVAAALHVMSTAFDARHRLGVRHERLNGAVVGLRKGHVAALLASD